MNIFLKTYCECNDKKAAEGIAVFIQEKLKPLCGVSIFKIEKYWKIEEYFEVSFDLEVAANFDDILHSLATGWEKSGADYIWNAKEGNSFISDAVRWSQLEIIE